MRSTPRPLRRELLTIGYEGRGLDDLVADLLGVGVGVVVDVRLTPVSRKPGFAKRRLAEALSAAAVGYVHLPALGNPRANRDGFRAGDPRSLDRFQALLRGPDAIAALSEIAELAETSRVALLCYERDPGTCHRRLVADEVVRRDPGVVVEPAWPDRASP